MNRKLFISIAILLVLSVIITGIVYAQSSYNGQKWEYIYVSTMGESDGSLQFGLRPTLGDLIINGELTEFEGNYWDMLNALGENGWELVSASQPVQGVTAWIFKRVQQ